MITGWITELQARFRSPNNSRTFSENGEVS
jgi:hypothetical protein